MDLLIKFFNHPFFSIVGGFSTVLAICLSIYSCWAIFYGIFPVWVRLGKSLSNRKIALYSESGFGSLKCLLTDSGVFKDGNIIQIHKDALAKGSQYSIMLVDYSEYKSSLLEILNYKADRDSLIVYAPASGERIPDSTMEIINQKRNSIVVNMRGRLLNDILISMITTSYEKN
ncbi:MAG TPA: hypothetical protein VJZ04_05670 [Lachnospiraceae bacterium]|nr:hypothetical protein [Lachnospiraceae bacterium]